MADPSIVSYDSLKDFYLSQGVELEQDTEFIIEPTAHLHDHFPIKSPLFRANYFSFLLIRTGRGSYTTDDQTFPTRARTLYFTNPGHLKAFEIFEKYEGYIFSFSEQFLKANIHENIFEEFPFLLAETVPANYLQNELFEEFWQLCDQIFETYQSNSPFKEKIIGNFLVVFLLKVKEHFWSATSPLNGNDQPSNIVKTFKINLDRHFRDLAEGREQRTFQAQDFAQFQHLHPSYLSTVLKSKTGKNISDWIADKLLTEAIALLSHSQLTIKEIAFRLGYSEATHFSRFFKKQTGKTANEFRKNNR